MGRLRFKPWSFEYLKKSKNFIEKENFNQTKAFKINTNPIYLEIGHGKGKFIINFAKMEPKINFIGIEKFPSVQVSAIKKIEDKEIENLVFLSIDAIMIDRLIKKDSISKIFINFPDPWPKEKHSKRRLFSKAFLIKYYQILKADGLIELRTDNYNFFLFAKNEITEMNKEWKIISEDKNLELEITTEYEDKFRNLEKPLFYLQVKKISI